MRENRTSGSEGGGAELNRLSLPLSISSQPRSVGTRVRDKPFTTSGYSGMVITTIWWMLNPPT
jgi:hypothetical protein